MNHRWNNNQYVKCKIKRIRSTKLIDMTKEDIEKAAKYLSDEGYGRGSNYTTNAVANLMAEYAEKQVKLFAIPVVVQQSELVCMCKGTTQVNRINDKYICCTCNKPLM